MKFASLVLGGLVFLLWLISLVLPAVDMASFEPGFVQESQEGSGLATVQSYEERQPARVGTEQAAQRDPQEAGRGGLRVHVRDKESGSGLRAVGIVVTLSGRDRLTAATDADGVAMFSRVPAGPVVVRAQTGGLKKAEVPAAGIAVVDFAAVRNPLGGRVVDEVGNPLPGASIWVSEFRSRQSGVQVACADSVGGFQLAFIGPGRYVGAEHPGHLPSNTFYTSTDYLGEESELLLVCPGWDRGMRGLVRSTAGEPISGAAILITPRGLSSPVDDAGQYAPPRARAHKTDELGTFRMEPWLPVLSAVSVSAPGFADYWDVAVVEDGFTVQLQAEAIVHGHTNIVGGVVRCVLRGDKKILQNKTVKTKDDGRYLLAGLQPGSAEITLESSGQIQCLQALRLEAGQEYAVDLNGSAGESLRGRLVLGQAKPGGVTVIVSPLDDTRVSGVQQALTGEDGAFSLEGLLPGPYVLQFRGGAWGSLPFHWHKVTVPMAAELVVRLEEDVKPSAFLEGVLTAGDEVSIHGAVVRAIAVRASGLRIIECRADRESGAFVMGPLAPYHNYTLSVRHSGGRRVQGIGAFMPVPGERVFIDPFELTGEQ